MNTREQEKTTPCHYKPRHFDKAAVRMHQIIGNDKKGILSRVLFLLGPLVALFQVELLNETNPYLNLEPDEFIMNMIWYAIVFFLSWLIFGRRRRAAVAACCFFEVIGIINHYVLEFRGRILFPHDISAIRTAVNVVDEYDFTPDNYIWGTLALMLVYFLLLKLFAVPQPERSYFKKKTITWIMGVLSAAYIVAFFFTGWLPAAGIKTQQWRTQSNGFVLNFTIALRYSRVDKPSDYSEQNITQQAQEVTSTHTDENPEMKLVQDTFLKKTGKAGKTSSSTVSSGIQPTNLICINAKSDKQEEAAKFLNFFFNDPEAIAILGDVRGVPPTEAARTQLEEAGTLNPLIGKAIALGEEHPGMAFHEASFNSELTKVENEYIERFGYGEATAEETASELLAELESICEPLRTA